MYLDAKLVIVCIIAFRLNARRPVKLLHYCNYMYNYCKIKNDKFESSQCACLKLLL